MTDITECPVCFDEYIDPKLLPCSHTLCLKCLENLVKNQTVRCPMCLRDHRVPDRGAKAFTDNQHAAQLVKYNQKLKDFGIFLSESSNKEPETDAPTVNITEPKHSTSSREEKCQVSPQGTSDIQGKSEAGPGAEVLESVPVQEAVASGTTAATDEEEKGLVGIGARRKEKRPGQQGTHVEDGGALIKLAEFKKLYDSKGCCHCFIEELRTDEGCRLRRCKSCQMPRYCSRKCQSADWKKRHRLHCKEIIALKSSLHEQEHEEIVCNIEDVELHATERNSWPISGITSYNTMRVHDGKQVIQTQHGNHAMVAVYDTSTGIKETVICKKNIEWIANPIVLIHNTKAGTVHVVFSYLDAGVAKLEFWPFKSNIENRDPVYTYESHTSFLIGSCDSMLLLYHINSKVIEEFDASEFPIKRTGHIIPVLKTPIDSIVTKHGNKKLLFITHFLEDSEKCRKFCLRCLNYENGRDYWFMNQELNLSTISPNVICTNQNGRIFIVDSQQNKILVLKKNRGLQPLLSAPGFLSAIGWCYKSNRLLVLYEKFDGQFTTTAFSIDKVPKGERNKKATVEDMIENLSISPKIPPSSQTSQQTFCQQKLALLQCEYDPKSCNRCSRRGTDVSLKACIKCKAAVYCSKQCQLEDWKPRHKKHCKEIQRLQNVVQNITKHFKLVQAKDPFLLDPLLNIPFSVCPMWGGQIVGYPYAGVITQNDTRCNVRFPLGNDTRGRKKVLCDICTLRIDMLYYIALIVGVKLSENTSIEIWLAPMGQPAPFPVCEYIQGTYTVLCHSSESLLAFNIRKCQVEEFDISSVQIKPTGFNIPVNRIPCHMSCLEQNGEKRLLYTSTYSLHNFDMGTEAIRLTCVDFTGNLLWQIGDHDNFYPAMPCVDTQGRIWVIDRRTNRIVIVRDDLTVETVFRHNGEITAMAWCGEDNQLYVIRSTDETNRAYCVERFNIVEEQ